MMKKALAAITVLLAYCTLAACSEKYPVETTAPQTSASIVSIPAQSEPGDIAALQTPLKTFPKASASGGTRGDNEQIIVGVWKLIAMEDQGDYMDLTGYDDISGFLVLMEDNKASVSITSVMQYDGSWASQGDIDGVIEVTITFEDEPIDATIADGRLILEQDGDKLIFEKESFL